jgi:branched-chain amino acid transport system permease protein
MRRNSAKPQLNKSFPLAEGALLLGPVFLLLLPVLTRYSDYVLQVFTHALILATLALAWNLLGISGSISLGHAAFFGVGAYGSALISLDLGLSPWFSIPLGGLLAIGIALIMGLFCLRLRGAYFALATLAFVEIPKVITDNWDSVTRGSLGLVGLPGLPNLHLGSYQIDIGGSSVGSYYFVLSYALFTLGLVALVFRSNFGLALHAIREEEVAAEAVGIQVRKYHLLSLVLSALFTGIGGACYAHLIRYIEPGLVFGLHFSAVPMIFAICGGRFTFIGPPLAALVLYPLDQFIFQPLLPAGHEFLYGVVIILAILFLPSGFWGRLRKGHLVSVKTGSIE